MKPMAPGSLSYYIASLFIYVASRLLFWNLYFPIYTTKIPKIFILLSLLDLTFASGREGIDNPFIALVARFLIVCAGTWRLITHKYRGSQQFSRVEYSTKIYRFDKRGAKEYLKVLAAELSIQPHLEINYLQQSDQQQGSLIVLIIVTVAKVTIAVL